MRKLLFLLLLIAGARPLPAQDNPRWLRYCAISPDGATIAFTYKGHLYTVPAEGGIARRLTRDSTYEFMPVWSHDSKQIAFAAARYGNFDLFITPARGGEPKRLTSHSADEVPYDFSSHDSTVLFGAVRLDAPANRQFPSDALPELYEVPIRGGRVTQLLTTTAEDARVSPSGRYLIYHDRKGRENPWRKHQTSSIARDIWLYDRQTGRHTKISSFSGEDRNPVFAGTDTAIYYLSEESGSFNVYQRSIALPSAGSRQLPSPRPITSFTKDPVRFLSISREETLCFGYDGEIYRKKKNTPAVKVRVVIKDEGNDKDLLAKKEGTTIPIGDADEMAVSPNGMQAAFIFHGDVFVCDTARNSVRRITRTAGIETGVSFSPDGRHLLYAGERDGRWKIFQAELALNPTANSIKESILIENNEENYQPQYSPDGKEIAYIENRTTLKIFTIASRQSRRILTGDQLYSKRDNDQYFKWSPDGKWLLLQFSEPGAGNDEIGIVRTDGKGQLINLTNSGFNDSQPKWTMGGRAILWLSDRNGLRSYAGSGARQQDVYALFLDPAAWKDFRWQDSSAAATTMAPITGDPRISITKNSGPEWSPHRARLSRQSSLLTDALLSADNRTLYYLARSDRGYDLWQTDLHTRTTKLLTALHAGDALMDWDSAKKNIFILADGKISRIDPLTTLQQNFDTHGEMTLDLPSERQAMFEHVWRRIDETFYTPGFHGINWLACKSTYQQYLPHIDNNYDFAEMLNELLGELNTSHTGASYHPSAKGKDLTASLGAWYSQAYKDTGLRIEAIMQDGPLDDPAFDIHPGDILYAIDGTPILPDRDYAGYLNRKAGKNILLTIRTGKANLSSHNNDPVKQITVRPITPDEETELVYQRWVRRNREETDSLSHGQLGYIHLYRMNDAAYRNAYDEVLGRYAGRKGLVVDTRFNRGGDLAPELTMFLGGARIRDNVARSFLVNSEPSFRWTRPSIVLACEANYSDGDCFVYDYQYLHMGKFVGMPVPGSCTFQTGQSLQDNTLQWSAPTLGVKDKEGIFLENHQSEPDIRKMNEPGKAGAGQDQQLETAIQVLLRDLR